MVVKEIYEGVRKALQDVLVPEIRKLRAVVWKPRTDKDKRFESIRDLDKRVTRIEAVIERIEKRAG